MRIGTLVAGVVIGAAAVLMVWLVGALVKDTPVPPIFASLPSKTVEVAPAVDRAVKARFPAGSNEDRLIADLSEMGFVIRRGDGGLWADYTAGGFVCTERFIVTWSARNDRSISEVAGDYHSSCL